MSAYESERRSGRSFAAILAVIVVAALVGGAIYLWPRFESQPPRVELAQDVEAVGPAPLEIRVADAGMGLKSIAVTLSAGGVDTALATERFAEPAREKTLSVAIPKGVKEGPATLKIVARDASLFRGNEALVQKQVTVDLTPPTLELVADDRYVNFGGVGVLAYSASPDTARSGVKVGERFFPGTAGQVKGHPGRFLVFFAHPYDAPPEAKAFLVATDKAGNAREMAVVYELKGSRYRKSTIALNDGFLQNKVAPLVRDAAARQGAVKDQFVAVNKVLRRENDARIGEVTSKVTPKILWQGAFSQLSNSKVEANFADFRTYTYNNESIDSAYHLGYDLSVTKRYPIEASNAGTVAFAGDLGIYGNTVILDHGLGLYTLYGHLSSIDVKAGDAVQSRGILGRSGETGLAAGDHLHFGVYLHGVAVLPVEWWDAKWIADNVTPKLEGGTGEEIHKAQAPAKASRAGVRKRRR